PPGWVGSTPAVGPERGSGSAAGPEVPGKQSALSLCPQVGQQVVVGLGLVHTGVGGRPEGLGCLTEPDEQVPVAGLYLRGLVVFEGVFGAVATQPGQTFGTPPTARRMRAGRADRTDEGPAPRQRGPGPVQRVTGRAGCRDRMTHQILFSLHMLCLGCGGFRARKSGATLSWARLMSSTWQSSKLS